MNEWPLTTCEQLRRGEKGEVGHGYAQIWWQLRAASAWLKICRRPGSLNSGSLHFWAGFNKDCFLILPTAFRNPRVIPDYGLVLHMQPSRYSALQNAGMQKKIVRAAGQYSMQLHRLRWNAIEALR